MSWTEGSRLDPNALQDFAAVIPGCAGPRTQIDTTQIDQHIDRMDDHATRCRPPLTHFDAREFGKEIRARREELGYSTRRMAHEVGVSQAYVVALEGSRSSRNTSGPCPTVEVLVGFALALGLHPVELLGSSLRDAGPHVLLVPTVPDSDAMGFARSQSAEVDVWLSAGVDADEHRGDHIDLHPDGDVEYRLENVRTALHTGLADLRKSVKDRRIGLVFSESDAALLGSTKAVLEAEDHWHQMVSRAAWSALAEPAAVVCKYDLDTVGRMADPMAASLHLIQSHDEVYVTSGRRTARGRTASMRLLQSLRPPGTSADEWRQTCASHLDRLTAA